MHGFSGTSLLVASVFFILFVGCCQALVVVYVNSLTDGTNGDCSTSSTNTCNLRAAFTLCTSSCSIILPPSQVLNFNGDYGELEISDNDISVTIWGNHSSVVFDTASTMSRFLSSGSSTGVTFSVADLSLVGFSSSANGGAFYFDSVDSIFFENSILRSNDAENGGE